MKHKDKIYLRIKVLKMIIAHANAAFLNFLCVHVDHSIYSGKINFKNRQVCKYSSSLIEPVNCKTPTLRLYRSIAGGNAWAVLFFDIT
jgi:hypothetical protein